ncbi:hypothetical protein PIB30_033210 [Stylosanthes scabra]|uniref:Disease resistance protein At4g27190-like leucine-rich repeats domain-containing protein n=1 Tax=Stylosanthes scabra TaxID=79078 RepID=A0ABU6SD85_9FABA|nr:hypothetical protein [Stylosanthes scabra]
MAKDLAMLNNLSIENCEKVVKIFTEDKTISELEDSTTTIVLDSLSSLFLVGVPLLKYFYPGQHKLQFPKLTKLNIEAYKWMILNCQEAKAVLDQQILIPLEQVDMLFHSLEKLSFYMRGAMLTWKLKSRKLAFGYSSQERVEEVLFEEKPMAGYVEFLSHLKGLRLHSLYTLKSIGFEHSWIHPILDNIQTLKVRSCYDIKNLVPSKVSFSSLTKLVVKYCYGLLYLFGSSTAESLSQLKEMKISDCVSMREIISKEDDESNESIIFEQLQVLHLERLPMLRWFYSGKRTLCFPSLQELSMFGELSRMTAFCPHIHINHPDSVKLRSGEFSFSAHAVQWEDNVDTTICKINDKKIGLRESQYFQEMWHGSLSVPEACFSNLESLVVHQCDFLSQVIPAHILPFLNNMKKLEVQKCRYVKTIFDVKCLTKDTTLLPIKFSLKKLVLEKLPNLDNIWNEDPNGILHFQLLQQVRVDACKSLTSLFPKSVAKDLDNLENLELERCESLVEIMAGIEATPEETIREIMFPSLTSLTLVDLPRFNCFYCSFHCVHLKTLNGHGDPQIENRVCFKQVTPELINLSLGDKEAKMIGHEECEGSHFCNINVLDMQSFNVKLVCDELPYAFLQKASCTKTLEVSNSSIKEIFCSQRPNLDCVQQFLSQLKELKLTSLSKLTSIGFEHSWIRESSILNLTQLTISKCDSMIYLFTSATAKSLTQLKKMKISYCKSMQWIVSNEGEAAIHDDQIVFKQLEELQFECLKSLGRFYNGGFTLSFPSLEKLEVFKCDRMETFCESTINTSKLSAVFFIKYTRDGTPLEDDLNSTLRNAYKTEVAKFVREVKELKLSEHPRIHEIWNAPFRVPSLCFIRLKILIVEKYEFTSVVIPSHILGLLCKLEELVVRQCDSVKAIFEVSPEAEDTQINSLRSSLKKLSIEQLPNLEHVWDSDPTQHITCFQSFQQVYVHGCNSLESLFPAPVAENLVKLEKLEVTGCDRLVEIVANDESTVEGAPKEFALKSMTSIKLWSLPELRCFYPAPYKLECPKLEEVHLFHCDKLKTFECEPQRFQHPQAENQAIFLPEKVFPCLKFVALCKEEIMMMLNGQFDVNDLSNLEALELQCFHDDSDTFPYELLQQFPTIEKLVVSCSSFKEIFCTGGPSMDCVKEIVIPLLKCLQLSTLSQLNSIGLEHSWMQHFSENLEKLQIDECHCLRSIVPSKVSFSSLIDLNISECNGLVNLFTPSTSKTLHQLSNMSIKNCESLKEIVSQEVEESSKLDEEGIMFEKLKTLSLQSLPNLGRFYNGSIALKFPSLAQLLLIDCNKMEKFSAGKVSVNRWTEIQFKEGEWKHALLLEDDLNSVVWRAFEGFY